MPARIFHIASRDVWQRPKGQADYAHPSLADEGFIHCSTAAQVLAVANAHFRGQQQLVLLEIDLAKLQHPVRFENLEGGEQMYPHIYGPLNRDAVVTVHDFSPGPDGMFSKGGW